ncbi:cation:proton antiporter [Candidatus Woesearchaeota archaeon]|jgi:cell volume regulation protein A|nr:cation:proton antiporter [Candidatus Woesearchaeota archaeon]
MMETLFYLTSIAVLLLIGILCSVVANRLKIPNVLLLILAGILLSYIKYENKQLVTFSPVFLTSISIIALVMILFDSSSKIKLKTFDTLSFKALKLSSIFMWYNTILLPLPLLFIYGIYAETLAKQVILALVFATLVSTTDSVSVMVILKTIKGRVAKMLEVESIINTPLAIILPFMLINLLDKLKGEVGMSTFLLDQILPFLAQIVVGIGSGVFVGIIIFKLMRKHYSEQLSPVALITAALLTYIIAENLEGSGVLAVVALGLFFGNIHVKQKDTLKGFSSMFSNSLEILVFILIGFMVNIPLIPSFFIKSLALFLIYLLIRFLAVHFSFRDSYSLNEKIFMSLNVSKGIAVAVVAFTLMTKNIPGIDHILQLILIFMVYSIATATIAEKFALKLLNPLKDHKKTI